VADGVGRASCEGSATEIRGREVVAWRRRSDGDARADPAYRRLHGPHLSWSHWDGQARAGPEPSLTIWPNS
jgi:hypothetical protein